MGTGAPFVPRDLTAALATHIPAGDRGTPKIVSQISASSIRNTGASSHSVTYLDAPPGIPQEVWDEAKLEERLALIEESANSGGASFGDFVGTHGSQIGGTALGTSPVMLSESRKIFVEHPARVTAETAIGAVVGGLGVVAGGIGGGMLDEYVASGIFNKVKHWFFPER